MRFSEEYRRHRSTTATALAPVVLGSVLCGGGMLHMWFHSLWGEEDWGVVAVIVLGAGLAFNAQVVALVRAWRGKP